MAALASFTLTSGSYSSGGPVYYGFVAEQHPTLPQIGTINGDVEYPTPSSWYSTTSLWNLYFLNYYTSHIYLRLRGASAPPANSGWASMSIASYGPYNRIDASYSTLNNPTYPRNAVWRWDTSTNPLFSGDYTVTIDDGVSLPVADTDLSFAVGTTAASTTAVTLSASGGSGGTRTYNRTTSAAQPTTGWSSYSYFLNNNRGDTYYYWTKITNSDGSSYYSEPFLVPYIDPDTTISNIADISIGSADTSFTITIASGGTSDVYQVRNRAGTEIHESRTGNGDITVTDSPSSNSSKDYSVYVKRPDNVGGSDTYIDLGSQGDFTVTKAPALVSGTVYFYSRNSVNKNDIAKDVFIDDAIDLSVSGLTNVGWLMPTTNCTANPNSGYSGSGNTTANPRITFSTAGSYSANFINGDAFDITVSGTVSDPWVVDPTNKTLSKSSINPSTANVESAAANFVTARSGETLAFSVTNGTLEKNDSGTWAATGTIEDGDTYKIRRNASESYSTSVTATVSFTKNSVEKGTVTYTVTTRAQDTYPASYDLGAAKNYVAFNSLQYSETITVTGIDSDATPAITISGTDAYYQINGGTWTQDAGTVALNDTVRVRQKAASALSTHRIATLNIGGRGDTFLVSTKIYFAISGISVNPGATAYRSFVVSAPGYGNVTFTGTNCQLSTDNSTWTSSVNRISGQTVYIKAVGGPNYDDVVACSVTGGGHTDAFNVTTRPQDVNPDSFNLGGPAQFYNRNTYIYPSLVTVAGIESDANIAVSVSGSTGAFAYSKNGEAYTTAAGTVTLGDTIQTRVLTSTSYNTTNSLTLSIGNQSDTYYATTEISFNVGSNVSNAEKSAITYRSFVVNSSAYGDSYITFTASGTASTKVSTDNATWVNSVTRKNGQTVYIKATASSSYASSTTATVTGGGISDSFTITTRAQVTAPTAFTLGSTSGVNRGSYAYSNEVTIAGMDSDASVTVSITGDTGKAFRYKTSSTAEWSGWRTSNLTGVINGYIFQARVTASSFFSTDTDCTLSVGGTSSTFTVTSEASTGPDTSVTFSTNTPAYEDTSFTLTTTGGGSTTDYVVRTTSYTGTSVGTFTGNASNLTINHTPSIAGTTYYVTGSVSDANDGTGVSSNVGTFTVTRSSGGGSGNENPDGTYGLELYDESGNLYLSISDNVAFFKFSGSGEYTPGTRVAPRTFTQVIDLSAYNLDITSDDFVYIHDRNKGGIAVFSAEITGQDEVTVTIYQLALSPNSNTRSYSYTIISTG